MFIFIIMTISIIISIPTILKIYTNYVEKKVATDIECALVEELQKMKFGTSCYSFFKQILELKIKDNLQTYKDIDEYIQSAMDRYDDMIRDKYEELKPIINEDFTDDEDTYEEVIDDKKENKNMVDIAKFFY